MGLFIFQQGLKKILGVVEHIRTLVHKLLSQIAERWLKLYVC